MRYTDAGDKIAFRDYGYGPPVLLIPGGPGLDAAYMAPLAAMIAAEGHRALLIEPRGTGASRAAIGDGSQLTVAGSVADVEAVRRTVGAGRVTILGHSFGGGVAQAYASQHAENVASLILMNSVGPDMGPTPAFADGWRDRLSRAELARYDEARIAGDRRTAMRLKFLAGFHHRRRGEEFVASIADSAVHLDLAPLSAAYARDFRAEAERLASVPVTILAGEIDWIRDCEPALNAAYPHQRTIVIPQAGHFPWADAADATRQALRAGLVQGS